MKALKKRVRSRQWWDAQEKDDEGDVLTKGSRVAFVEGMTKRCGEVLALEPHVDGTYREVSDPFGFVWEDWMFEDKGERRALILSAKKTGRWNPWKSPSLSISLKGTLGELADAVPELLESCVEAGILRGALITRGDGETTSVGKPPCYCKPKGESPLEAVVKSLEAATEIGDFSKLRVKMLKEVLEEAVKMGDIKGATIEGRDGKMLGYGTGKGVEGKRAPKKKAIEK